MSKTVQISATVPKDLLRRFDEVRGLVPRSALLQELMRDYLEREGSDGRA